jgi:hypothetical protein
MHRGSDETWEDLRLSPLESLFLGACEGDQTLTQIAQGLTIRPDEATRLARRFFANAAVDLIQPSENKRLPLV